MAVADVLGLGARLPVGYRAREFEDGDREWFVAERNREQHWMQQGSAAEWRYWENLMTDPTRLRVSVDAPDGSIAAIGDIGVGAMARPDRSQFMGMTVLAPHRRKGIGAALLEALEDEARRRDVPRLLAGANEGEKFALDWALAHGYREIGRRIASYVDLAKFEPARFSEALDRARTAGIKTRSFAETLEERDAAAQEQWWRALYAAEAPMCRGTGVLAHRRRRAGVLQRGARPLLGDGALPASVRGTAADARGHAAPCPRPRPGRRRDRL